MSGSIPYSNKSMQCKISNSAYQIQLHTVAIFTKEPKTIINGAHMVFLLSHVIFTKTYFSPVTLLSFYKVKCCFVALYLRKND